ncbi:MAG: alpha/beta hydrolase, partial [Actinobacteria bacterium]|nr:alpha/beta hydrolase [Actinomycetota bacterium]
MPIVQANGIDICYEESGSADDPALLLVNGFTSQLISWTPGFVDQLVDAGFRVVCFDNRDVGLTTKSSGEPPQYSLADMAADGIALLTSLGIARAHIVGASMGGMIVQRMTIDHPDRVRSLTSIMSTTGDARVGKPDPDAITALLSPPPTEREAYLDHSATLWRRISGPLYDEDRARQRAATSYDRCFNPAGAAYQMAAIMADGDRTQALAGVRCPTLVIHGRVDPLVRLSGGEATAAAVPGAELLVLDDMGHDLP